VPFLHRLTGENPFTFSHCGRILKSFERGIAKLEKVQSGANKVVRVLGNLAYGERVRKLGLFGLGMVRLRGSK